MTRSTERLAFDLQMSTTPRKSPKKSEPRRLLKPELHRFGAAAAQGRGQASCPPDQTHYTAIPRYVRMICRCICVFNSVHFTLCYSTLHYVTLHYITPTALHRTRLDETRLVGLSRIDYIMLRHDTLQYSTMQCSTLCDGTLSYTTRHGTVVHSITLTLPYILHAKNSL